MNNFEAIMFTIGYGVSTGLIIVFLSLGTVLLIESIDKLIKIIKKTNERVK